MLVILFPSASKARSLSSYAEEASLSAAFFFFNLRAVISAPPKKAPKARTIKKTPTTLRPLESLVRLVESSAVELIDLVLDATTLSGSVPSTYSQ